MRFDLKVLLLLLVLSGVLYPALYAGKSISLAEKGKIQSKVVTGKNASPEEVFAKGFLEDYLEKVTGGKRVKEGKALPIRLIARGKEDKALPEDVKKKLAKNNHSEAFLIKLTPETILIAGNSPQAVLYGVFTFVEKYLGVRWFHAGKDGEHCPRTSSIRLAPGELFQAPSFRYRGSGGWKLSVAPWDLGDYHIWQIRNKMQVRTPQMNRKSGDKIDERSFGNRKREYGNHLTFVQAVPNGLYAKHPEYFPLQKGKRTLETRSQRCVSNPKVRKMVEDYAIKKGKQGALFGVGFHDSIKTWCECENCVKMGTYKGRYSVSTLAHRFVTQTTANILKACPEAGGQRALIYANFREFVEDPAVKYDERVMVLYCSHGRCYVHPLDSQNTSCNKKTLERIKQWRPRCPYMGIYDYYAYSDSPYCPLEYVMAKDLKYYYHTLGLRAFYDDNTNKKIPVTESNWQFHYALSKLLWDVDLDMEALMEETYTLYYGKAAKTMKEYHALRRHLWESAPGHVGYCITSGRYRFCIPNDKTALKMLSLVRKALGEAKGDATLTARIKRDEKFLQKFWITEGKKARAGVNAHKQRIRVFHTLDEKMTLDGVLDENVWKKATGVKGFLTREKSPPPEETEIKTAFDSRYLYFGATLMTQHTWGKLKADAVKKDSHVYLDDSIEFFVGDGGKDYYHFVVNSRGTLYDALLRDASWDSGAEIKTKVLPDRFIVEARIPFAAMKIDPTNANLQMHFFRNSFSLQPPANEVKYGLNGAAPHQPAAFMKAYVNQAPALLNGDFSQFTPGEKQKFPRSWSGRKASYDAKSSAFFLKGGSLWSKLNIRNHSGTKYRISGVVQLSGKGRFFLEKSTCIRKKGDKRPFKHEKREVIFKSDSVEEEKYYPVSFDIEKDETGFFLVHGNNVKVRSVLLFRWDEKGK